MVVQIVKTILYNAVVTLKFDAYIIRRSITLASAGFRKVYITVHPFTLRL